MQTADLMDLTPSHAVTKTPHCRTPFLPARGQQLSPLGAHALGTTPFPEVACASRTLSP